MSARCTSFAAAFAALISLSACGAKHPADPALAGADPRRGRELIAAHQCGVCHVIPGIRDARGHVGPTLERYRANVYIAGRYPNAAEVLMTFVRDAPSLSPRTAMPAFEMTEADARDIAAYLYTLE